VQSVIELARIDGDSINAIRVLNNEEVLNLNNFNKTLFEFNRHFKLVEYVLHNFSCLSNVIENSIQQFSQDTTTISRYDLDSFGHEININLLNLMMAARTFLDHMETFIKREYGKESEEIRLFDSLKSEEFDTKFSYKFMYKLRNYVQHCGMPPLSYSKIKTFDVEQPFATLTLEFDRDALLASFDGWGTIVKPALQAQENKFNAFNIIEEFVKSIITIYIRFNDKNKFQKTLQAREHIANAINQSTTYYIDDYCLMSSSNKTDDNVTFNLAWIPASLFQKIEHYLQLRNQI
jgi:hypothetical protein